MNTSTTRQDCAIPIIFVHYVHNLQTDAAPMLWFVGCQNYTTFKLAPLGMRGSLGLESGDGLLYQTPGTFSQQALLEPLALTGASASCFDERYRDLLLYLPQKLYAIKSNQQVKTAVQQYRLYSTKSTRVLQFAPAYILSMICIYYVESNSVLVADGDITSAVSPTRRGAPRKDVWNAEPPPWVHAEKTGWTASTMNIGYHTKHENERRSLALLGKHDQAHLEQHSDPPASAATVPRSMPCIGFPSSYCASSSQQSPFLLMTNQNQTSPAPHPQNQPPDSGSVLKSQRQQL